MFHFDLSPVLRGARHEPAAALRGVLHVPGAAYDALRPAPRHSPMTLLLGLVLGAIAGAAAMSLLDPARGRARRARLADQAAAAARSAARDGSKRLDHLGSTVAGKASALTHITSGSEPANDEALADKVRSELFADPAIPKSDLLINVEGGTVVLRGEVESALMAIIERKTGRIPGVREVRNLLRPKAEAIALDT